MSPPPLRPARRWRLAPPPPASLTHALAGTHPIVARVLAARGITDAAAARAFLDRSPGDDNPFRLAGMDAAVARVRQAIRGGEPIAVYGDYDADGVTATALLTEALAAVGAADVRQFIPHRERDGYGVHAHALEALAREGVRLVVTVDCGIRAAREIDAVARQGLDVIVTDHHALPADLPAATAVINPRRPDCRYGYPDLAGVGLAFKLAQALLRVERRTRRGAPGGLDEADLLDLAALGTVADMVPLVGENRAIVHRGLERLRGALRPGLRALVDAAGVRLDGLTARALGFDLGPRINAAGRVDDARAALDLLLTQDPAEAARLAASIERHNTERRAAQDEAAQAAETRLAGATDAPFLLDVSPDVPLGVVGLVAGRLAERHYRPAAVLKLDGDVARGSARSIPEFDIVAGLDQVADLLVKHGGHARAAGFTVHRSNLAALRERLSALAAEALRGLDLRPALDIAAEVGPADVGWPLLEALEGLEPYGQGNPAPLLLWRDAPVASRRAFGAEQRHLGLRLGGAGASDPVEAVAFHRGGDFGAIGDRVDVVFTLGVNTWQGARRIELKVEDLAAPGTATGAGEPDRAHGDGAAAVAARADAQSRMTTGVPMSAHS